MKIDTKLILCRRGCKKYRPNDEKVNVVKYRSPIIFVMFYILNEFAPSKNIIFLDKYLNVKEEKRNVYNLYIISIRTGSVYLLYTRYTQCIVDL